MIGGMYMEFDLIVVVVSMQLSMEIERKPILSEVDMIRPTEQEKAWGREFGWNEHAIETGYEIMSYYDNYLPFDIVPLDVEAVMDMGTFERYYEENKDSMPDGVSIDDMAALQAMEDGYCKIIPIDELPKELHDRYKFFGWVDTPENRKTINIIASLAEDGKLPDSVW